MSKTPSPTTYRILVTGKIHESGLELLEAEPDLEVDFRPDLPHDDILKIIADYQCIVTRSETNVDKALIDAAPELKVIAVAAVGVAHVDTEYATERGILVMNTPGKNTNSAAELTMSLLLAACRKLINAHDTMRQSGWDRHRFSGMELMGKTIGIIGLGNVGHRVAQFAHGFDMRVISYDPYIPAEKFDRHRARNVDLETLLRESDIITVHVPKTPETIGIIGTDEIAAMKPGVVVINAARGGIIDEEAMLEALKSGKIAAAGIDTWNVEPPVDNRFKDLPNVAMSPHIGASTPEAQKRIAETIADQVPRALRGGIVDAPVNMPQIRMLQGNLMTAYTVLAEKLGLFAAQFIDFAPTSLNIVYRGDIAQQDCTLLRLAFLKGLLNSTLAFVSYVNAEQRAKAAGITVQDIDDPKFTDYESAVRFILSDSNREFQIGGVVFSGPHPRITLVDGFAYEVSPEGSFLLIRCHNELGVLGAISGVLDRNQILIHRLDFSHSARLKRTMFMFRIGKRIGDEVLEQINALPAVRMVRQISL